MAKDLYKKLAKHLDQMPGGFPATESGVELRILRRLFSEDEAALAMKMSPFPEQAKVIARRARMPVEEAAERLESMAKKGLIYRLSRKNRPPRYSANQFVIGIWEYHVNDLDPELIKDFNEYVPYLIDLKTWKKAPQLRTVPLNRSLDVNLEVLPFESAVDLVKRHTRFVEAPCICRREHRMVGEGCDKPEGACLVMGTAADYYEKNELGRRITQDEALEILKLADQAGLVLQPSYSKKIANICCCCGCCCQVLSNIKKHPEPAALMANPFIANLNREACIGCGVCERRCQVDAIRLEQDIAVLEERRCIGCGLCVTTCPSGALTIVRKPEPLKPEIPDTLAHAWVKRARARGVRGHWGLLKFSTRALLSKLRRV
jgi:electron transport complex protein RnfB